MPEEAVGAQHSKRCHVIFWVVYMLDQEFAALIGATSSIRDEDITNKLPSQADDSLSSLSLTLHVQLARLIARLLGSKHNLLGCFVCLLTGLQRSTELEKTMTGLSLVILSLS